MSAQWHADAELLTRYRDGRLDASAVFSIEAHLADCAVCQRTAGGLVEPDRLAGMWERIVDEVDEPRRTAVERLLGSLGVPAHTARLIAATPALTVPWIAAVAAVLGFAAASVHLRPVTTFWFLLLAPLVPLAGVATAYGPGLDPTYELGVAAPLRGVRLLLLRATAVLVTSVALCAAAALLLPGIGLTAVMWILPALAVTAAGLAAGTFAPPVPAAVGVGVAWGLVALGAELAAAQQLAVFGGVGQVAAIGVAALAAVVVVARAHTFDEGRWVRE